MPETVARADYPDLFPMRVTWLSIPSLEAAPRLPLQKKLGRRWIGFELSDEYVHYGNERLSKCKVGQALVGPEDPVSNAPKNRCWSQA